MSSNRHRKKKLIKEPVGLGLFLFSIVLVTAGIFAYRFLSKQPESRLEVTSLTDLFTVSVSGEGAKESSAAAYISRDSRKTVTLSRESRFYAPFETQMALFGGFVSSIGWELGPSRTFSQGAIITYNENGSGISVTTEPGSAELMIDEKPVGASPRITPDIAAGFHTVTAKKDGYIPHTASVEVKRDAEAQVFIQLMAIPVPEAAEVIRTEPLEGNPEPNFLHRWDWDCDESLADQTENGYQPADTIIFENLSLSEAPFGVTTEEWVKGIYYYTTTHLSYSDIPYHFLIDSQGKIYEGKKGGCEAVAVQNDGLDESVTGCRVGYLGKLGESVTRSAEQSFESLIVTAKPATYRAETTAPLSIEAEPETTQSASVIYKNTGSGSWYSAQRVSVRPLKVPSEFIVTSLWKAVDIVVSLVQPWIGTGGAASFEIPLMTPKFPGAYEEQFALFYVNKANEWVKIEGSEFTLKVTSKGAVNQWVKIKDTGLGFLRVRSGPGSSYSEQDRITTGQTLPFLGEENGWVKIRYDVDKVGWVSGTYIQKL